MIEPRGAAVAWASRVVVIVASVIAYANGLGGAFVFDDVPNIVERVEHLSAPLSQVVRGEQRPLVTLTLALNHRLGGLEPPGYHVVNLAIHVAAALLLLELIAGSAARLELRGGRALATAAAVLWAVHPLGTESVTYVIQRSEAMTGLACLAMLYAPLRASERRRAGAWSLCAVAACAAGMASKGTMVAAPVIAFAFDGLVLSKSFACAARARWRVHLALAGCWLVLIATGVVAGVLGIGVVTPASVGVGVAGVTPWEYLCSQPGVILHYARLLAWPSDLCIDRRWPVADDSVAIVITTAVVLIAILITLVAVRRRYAWAFPAAAAFLWLAPTSSVVPIRDLAVEHRTYLPSACAIVLVVSAARAILARLGGRTAPSVGAAAVAVAAIGFGWSTVERNRDYATPIALWTSTLDVVPDNPRAQLNLAAALIEDGRAEEAIGLLESAIAAAPNDARARLDYGIALIELGRDREAIAPLSIAAAAMRDRPEVRALLADALRRSGEHDAARRELRRVYESSPSALVCLALGNEVAATDDLAGAAALFAEAAERAESEGDRSLAASAHFNLGNMRFLQEDHDGAAEAYRRAVDLDPGHAEARRWLQEAERRGG